MAVTASTAIAATQFFLCVVFLLLLLHIYINGTFSVICVLSAITCTRIHTFTLGSCRICDMMLCKQCNINTYQSSGWPVHGNGIEAVDIE